VFTFHDRIKALFFSRLHTHCTIYVKNKTHGRKYVLGFPSHSIHGYSDSLTASRPRAIRKTVLNKLHITHRHRDCLPPSRRRERAYCNHCIWTEIFASVVTSVAELFIVQKRTDCPFSVQILSKSFSDTAHFHGTKWEGLLYWVWNERFSCVKQEANHFRYEILTAMTVRSSILKSGISFLTYLTSLSVSTLYSVEW
jgi:hypothetical protein